jgi:gliding motility-associated-like protein
MRYLLFVLLLSFSVTSNSQNGTWTWMHGSNADNGVAVWGTQGIAAPGNTPPALYETANWTDGQGNFWIFGGIQGNTFDYHNGLWRFEPATNNWTWMSGPQTQSAGVYGTQGVPSTANYPGARAYGAATWTDNSGHLWLFGGRGIDANGFDGLLSDLWRYTIATNEWTWMKGPNTSGGAGVFGIRGVADPGNLPPPRDETNATWERSNELWLFGGTSGFDDMWKYDQATNNWTWMSGSNSGAPVPPVWGSKQIPATTNTPGSRCVYSHWKDQYGNFWLWGGFDLSSAQLSVHNDMWKYDPATLQWTWMAGTNLPDPLAEFFMTCNFGTEAPAGNFEGRACWTDECGNFWQLGGFQDISTSATQNALWMFNPATLQFNWINGTLLSSQLSSYGSFQVSSAGSQPGGQGGSVGFTSQNGDFWLFGGYTIAQSISNTLWRYQRSNTCPETNGGSIISPNVFTPNGDGINDIFVVSSSALNGFEMEIFSRWGNSLFRSSNPAQGWDGTFNGSPAEEGVYYWRLRTTDCFGNPQDASGFVTLMR